MKSPTQQRTFLYMKFAAVTLLAAVLCLLVFQSNPQNPKLARNDRTNVSDLGPVSARPALSVDQFKITDLNTSTVKNYSIKDFGGNILHIIFWASWCEPCRTEMPALEKLIQRETNYKILLVNVDKDKAGIKTAKAMQKLLIPSALGVFEDTAPLEELLNVEALPFHVIIDKEGRIATAFYTSLNERKKYDDFTNLLHQLRAEEPVAESSR